MELEGAPSPVRWLQTEPNPAALSLFGPPPATPAPGRTSLAPQDCSLDFTLPPTAGVICGGWELWWAGETCDNLMWMVAWLAVQARQTGGDSKPSHKLAGRQAGHKSAMH